MDLILRSPRAPSFETHRSSRHRDLNDAPQDEGAHGRLEG